MKRWLLAAVLVIAAIAAIKSFGGGASSTADASEYGALDIKGSDTEVQLVSALVEEFLSANRAEVTVTGGGSGTGIASLLSGEIRMANSSRPLTDEEQQSAAEAGLNLKRFVLARDGLTVIVHPSNPIAALTLEQISSIYRGDTLDWKNIGGASGPITLYGRQSTSGTYVYFRDAVVKGDYAPTMRSLEGTQAIVEAVQGDPTGIGYVGIGYVRGEDGAAKPGIKPLLVKTPVGDVSPLDTQAFTDGRYPISRPIFQFVATDLAKDDVVASLLKFEASDAGKAVLTQSGFYPPTADDERENASIWE